MRLELGRDGLVQGQAALIYPLVAAHANSIAASPASPMEPNSALGEEGDRTARKILIQT